MKKITTLLLMLLLFITTVTTSVSAVTPKITVDNAGNRAIIAANGLPIIIESGSTEGLTNIIVDTNNNGVVDIGETPIILTNHNMFSAAILLLKMV